MTRLGLPLLLLLALTSAAVASPPLEEDSATHPPRQSALRLLEERRRAAAADLLLASEWMAFTYRIPPRVPQEMLLAGHSYADTLVALALMGEGASLNRVLELRASRRWPQVAVAVGVDPESLPEPIQAIMGFGRNQPRPPVLRFLPDVRPGLADRLVFPAFSPTIPSPAVAERFALDEQEVANVRRVLADPAGCPEEWLELPAGRGLTTADWVIAGVLSHLKPWSLQAILETRRGEVVAWSDVVLMFGLAPDVLTQGPLSAVYPLTAGVAPHTVLCGRKRRRFPEHMPLTYDLARLTPGEKRALRPLMAFTYGEKEAERQLLRDRGLEMAEEALALSLARMARLDLAVILERRDEGDSWREILRRYGIDLTGQEALEAAIRVRE